MTIAENTDPKTDSTSISHIVEGITDRRPLTEDLQDVQRSDESSNLNTEVNPLLENDRKNSAVKLDVSIVKMSRTDKDESGRASVIVSRKDPEADGCNVVTPPDGGLRAWMVMIGSFIINGVLFSVINTYSLIYLELQKRLQESGETAASSKAGKFCVLLVFLHFFNPIY